MKIVDDAIPIGLMSHACRFHVQYRTVGSTVVFVKLIGKMRGEITIIYNLFVSKHIIPQDVVCYINSEIKCGSTVKLIHCQCESIIFGFLKNKSNKTHVQ